jgi:hypothetical protein
MDDLYIAVRELTTAVKELQTTLPRNEVVEQITKPLTPQEAADFLSVPLATFRHWQTVKKLHPMIGFSTKHPRYDKEYLYKILKDGFVDAQLTNTRERLNKKRRKGINR